MELPYSVLQKMSKVYSFVLHTIEYMTKIISDGFSILQISFQY